MLQEGDVETYWPFKTTVKFTTDGAQEISLEYLVSANRSIAAKCELERRLIDQEVFGYIVERSWRQRSRKQRCSGCHPAVFSYWVRRCIQRQRTVLGQ